MKIKDTKKVEEIRNKLSGEKETEEVTKVEKVETNVPEGYRVNKQGRLTNTKRMKLDNDAIVVVKSHFKGKITLQTDSNKPINFAEELIMTKDEYGETAEISHQFVQYLKRHHPNVFKKGYLEIMDKDYIELEKMDRVMPDKFFSEERLNELFKKDSKGYIMNKELVTSEYKNSDSWDEKTLIAQHFLKLIKEDEIKRSDEEFLREIIKIEN